MQALTPVLIPWGELRPQPASDWEGPAGLLPEAVAQFYLELGPWGETVHESVGPTGLSIDAGGNPVHVPPLRKLWGMQAGYAWSRNPEDRLPGWPDDWLVVAMEGANPFIFDRKDGRVHFAFAGMGKAGWQPRTFAPDLPTAIAAIATVANALASLGDAAYDEDFNLAPGTREHVEAELASFAGSMERAKEMLAAWEWYL